MASSVTGLHHLQVAAPPGCEEDARRFYGALLGLVEIPWGNRLELLAPSGS